MNSILKIGGEAVYRSSPKASANLPSSPGKRRSRKRAGGGSGDENRGFLLTTF